MHLHRRRRLYLVQVRQAMHLRYAAAILNQLIVYHMHGGEGCDYGSTSLILETSEGIYTVGEDENQLLRV